MHSTVHFHARGKMISEVCNLKGELLSRDSGYEKVPLQELSNDELPDTTRPHSRRQNTIVLWGWKACLLFAALLCLLFAVAGLIYISALVQKTHKQHWTPCGNTPTEARNGGCHFEPMMSSWMPDRCFFKELVDEYDDIFETWKWYSDLNLTQEITGASELDALRAGNYMRVYTSHEHAHELHCVYTWRKVAIALERNVGLVDSTSLKFHHSSHCAKSISRALQKRPDSIRQQGAVWPLMFRDCVPLVYA
jgi:hypothetical protein